MITFLWLNLATGLGLVLTTASQSLHSLRPQIERFTQPSDYSKATLSKNWQYLDGMLWYLYTHAHVHVHKYTSFYGSTSVAILILLLITQLFLFSCINWAIRSGFPNSSRTRRICFSC